MTIVSQFRDLVRRAIGFHLLSSRLDQINRSIEVMGRDMRMMRLTGAREEQALELLPGTPYSRYALPLDYTPSRRFEPRWGYSRPVIQVLHDWFASYREAYRRILDELTGNREWLARVPHQFDTVRLPEPAWLGVPLAPFDSAAIYTMVRRFRPKRYFEIGSGISTCFAVKAIRDHGLGSEVISIDPEPRAAIDRICNRIIRDGLETCDPALFDQLEPGDILFFDGSHRSFMNSDVTVFMIDVLPRLKPGVVVHVHDINLPYDYPDSFKHWYWNEQYMLAVYMMNARDRIDPIFPTAFVCRDPDFDTWFRDPLVDLGPDNAGWRGGGSMWFTHSR